jgi:signal transduction histidine kinase
LRSGRSLTTCIIPNLLLGLQVGAASFCREFSEQHRIAVEFTHDGDLKQIPETISVVLFRVLQEALGNVAKHSGADRVSVFFSVEGDQARMRVTDRGRGFEIDTVQTDRGLGLISMRERLRLVGGTMSITSSSGQGTEVEVVVSHPGCPRQRDLPRTETCMMLGGSLVQMTTMLWISQIHETETHSSRRSSFDAGDGY